MSPREWAYWCASERLDPDGGQAELASLVATQVINAIQGVAAGMGGQAVEEDRLLPPDAFVAGRYEERQQREMRESLQALRKNVGW